MLQLFDRPVFAVGEVRYSWGDVVLFAMLTGRWGPLEREIQEGLACVRYAEQTGAEEPADAIDGFAADFRYERDLITAEETEVWLEARQLQAGEWMEWARREVLRQHWAGDLERLVEAYAAGPAEVVSAAAVDLLCGSRGRALVADLAKRAAATGFMEEAGEGFFAEPPPGAEERIHALLPDLQRAETRARLSRLAALEQGYTRFRARAATPERIRRELEQGRLDWIRLHCRVIQFESETLAREAVLCVREDGLRVDEVAESAHAPVQEMRFYLGELDPELQPRLLAAAPRELVGPVPFENRHALFLVLDKELPDTQAPELREVIEQRAIARAETDQVNHRVRWLEG
jgi:hypothetical protein